MTEAQLEAFRQGAPFHELVAIGKNMNDIHPILKTPLKQRRPSDGWCEQHGHYCPLLEVNRTAARVYGAIALNTALTVEERRSLFTGKGK
jgi:hypothetical protein